jgi:glycosyltransferase involved in cell wall biosynthesis
MKILLSAFACDPAQGSEPGVGWTWAYQLAKKGHDVCVLTRDRHRASIEAALLAEPIPNLRFIYFEVRRVPYKIVGLSVYPFYWAWQLKAYLLVKKLEDLSSFDCIHHVTYASYRTPFFLAWLGVPSIFGPVGGGEVAPIRMTKGMSLKGKIHEFARIGLNIASSLAPMDGLTWRHPVLILTATEETRQLVPEKYRSKCKVLSTITTPAITNEKNARRISGSRPYRVLFVGRLLEWKGVQLAIRALSIARKTVPDILLTIIGDGQYGASLRSLERAEGLQGSIEWVSRMPRSELLDEYEKHDLLVLPSLHDSGGMVLLEALAQGVPVICLKLGGPGVIVDSRCGAAIDVSRRSVEEVIQAFAGQLVRFATMSEAEAELIQAGTRSRAAEFTVDEVVGKAYAWFSEIIAQSPSQNFIKKAKVTGAESI